MNIDQVIQTCRAIAEQHYPDDSAKRNEYLVGLLETKLREVAHRTGVVVSNSAAPNKFSHVSPALVTELMVKEFTDEYRRAFNAAGFLLSSREAR